MFNVVRGAQRAARAVIALIAVALLPSLLHAQGIRGNVRTATGAPIADAVVSVLNAATTATTAADGAFTLNVAPGTYTLAVRAAGYVDALATATVGSAGPVTIAVVLRARGQALPQVVVTAERREASLISAPVAVTTLDASEVRNSRSWGLEALSGRIPNYLYQELGGPFQQIQSIRGIQVFSENPAIATYVDGVNALDILGNGFSLTDIESIEVLRGPQGTLFGRTAMGGVVNITTRAPSNRTEQFAEFTTGNLGLQRGSLGFKAPLVTDRLFLGVTALSERRNGFLTNDTTGTFAPQPGALGARIGDEQRVYGALKLQWLPTDRVRAVLDLKAQENASDQSGFFVAAVSETAARNNPDRLNLPRVGSHDHDVFNGALSVDVYAGPVKLTSVSTYQRIRFRFADIESGGVFSSYFNGRIGAATPPQQVYSQELRASGGERGDRLRWVVGAYGFDQVGYEPTTNLGFLLNPITDTWAIFRNESRNNGLAVFGQATLALGRGVEVVAGLRRDDERREATFNGFGDASYTAGIETVTRPDTTVSGRYSAWTPKLAITKELGAASSVYASYTRGFRAGGVNAQRLPSGLSQTFEPEYSDNFEVGAKSRFFDDRVFVSATAFRVDWTDLQFFSVVGPSTVSRANVGDARSQGIELEVSALPHRDLRLDAAAGFNGTEYVDFTFSRLAPDFVTEIETDASGNRLSNAPSRTLFLAAEYTPALTATRRLLLRGELRQIGDFYTDVQNDLQQDAFTVLNGRVALQLPRAEVALWVQNLTDERYLDFGSPDTGFNRRSRISAPRTFGLTLSTRF